MELHITLAAVVLSVVWLTYQIRKIFNHGNIDAINRVNTNMKARTENMKDALKDVGETK